MSGGGNYATIAPHLGGALTMDLDSVYGGGDNGSGMGSSLAALYAQSGGSATSLYFGKRPISNLSKILEGVLILLLIGAIIAFIVAVSKDDVRAMWGAISMLFIYVVVDWASDYFLMKKATSPGASGGLTNLGGSSSSSSSSFVAPSGGAKFTTTGISLRDL